MGTVTTRPPGYAILTEYQRRRYRTRAPRIASVRARSAPYVAVMPSATAVRWARVAGVFPAVTAATHAGVRDSSMTSRPPWTNPASARTGIVTATPTSQTAACAYAGRNRSQKCTPMQPWIQAISSSAVCS